MARTAGRSSRWAPIALCLTVLAGLASWLSDTGPRPAPTDVSVADLFENPRPYPGEPWMKDNGPVPSTILSAWSGGSHCEMQSAAILILAWPVGGAGTSGETRAYARDPNGVVAPGLAKGLVLHARLPVTARRTGYTARGVELWTPASDVDDAVYLVGRGGAERWPRADPLPLCA